MDLDDKTILIEGGDMALIEDGVFHRVHNTGNIDIWFVYLMGTEKMFIKTNYSRII